MTSKSPELRVTEKRIKEDQKHAQEAARRERAKAVVDAAKYIGSFRVMNAEAEAILETALDKLSDPSKYVVSVDKNGFERNISDNFALICEELQQYGVITAYILYGTYAQLTLSEAGKTYFREKEAETNAQTGIQEMSIKEKKPMLLISHATADKEYVEAIITLLENIGLNQLLKTAEADWFVG